ncbi:MAG TPA: hypothetical protein VMU45_02825 [Candidatus Eisenbacteria bacterium]|nr:hypothetical protein [Candidatus Eisenbacteria bacterium]
MALLLAISICLASAAAQDSGWPRQITKPGGKLVVYQPQVDDWRDYQTLDLRAAFTITPTGGKTQVGALTATATTTVNFDTHTVFLNNPQITSVTFPSTPANSEQLGSLVRTFLNPSATMTISLDRLVASVKKTKAPPTTELNNQPPTIYVSLRPAILLMVNGSPTMGKIANSNMEFVVNANWPLFQVQGGGAYYLFNGKGWMTAPSLDGTWTATAEIPPGMSAVPANANFASLKQFVPPPPGSAATSPVVYYSATPAEIVVFSGMPQWTPIPGTQLSYASNTGSPVFKYGPTGAFYFLTSGRWFTATSAMGPWTFATYSLPPDFARIPPSSPMGSVLASVPGTPEAEDAVLIAQIPTTVTVNPANAAAEVKVSYVGSPQFLPITGTTMSYATNTPNKVIQVGLQYYLCYQGIWFVAPTPTGPWQTAQTVPQVIYTIPPSSPVYNVTYVTQTTLPSGDVQASYTAGYMGAFITGAAVGAIVACGTGYYYPPYIYGGYYYPYAATYGYHAYNPYYGAYGYGGAAYGPYGSAHWGTAYNPYTGTYARGATESTPYGTRAQGEAYNPYTGASAATRQGSNAYGSWGQSVYSKNGNTAYTQHASNAYGSEATAQTSAGGKAAATSTPYGNTAAGKTASGDMYAGHNGNVYKNTGNGWQKYDNGSWNTVNKSTAQQSAQSFEQQHPAGSSGLSRPSSGSYGDLDQEAQNRARGDYQSRNWSQYQHSGGWGSGGRFGGGGWGGGDRWGGGGDRWGGGGFRR